MEAEDLRAQVLRAREEQAARLMQQCLNRICNSKYAYAWYQWRAVIKSMLKAARTMTRCRLFFVPAFFVSVAL